MFNSVIIARLMAILEVSGRYTIFKLHLLATYSGLLARVPDKKSL